MTTTMLRDVMTDQVASVRSDALIADAARLMRDRDIGDVLVVDDDRLRGIVTDRDLVVRCLADSAGPHATVGQACSPDVMSLGPDSSVDDAVQMMREHAL
ncbi:CBS domain-containing protein, partial [Gordonia sp. (in: high G+C Gram-positive bacteria)]|uniref:CBS domain-containing protein n=1 Tax=Gordonia sp. (in: high G+C Gram-positive bacteria) TaxID=84139 RepID=UPI0025C466F7